MLFCFATFSKRINTYKRKSYQQKNGSKKQYNYSNYNHYSCTSTIWFCGIFPICFYQTSDYFNSMYKLSSENDEIKIPKGVMICPHCYKVTLFNTILNCNETDWRCYNCKEIFHTNQTSIFESPSPNCFIYHTLESFIRESGLDSIVDSILNRDIVVRDNINSNCVELNQLLEILNLIDTDHDSYLKDKYIKQILRIYGDNLPENKRYPIPPPSRLLISNKHSKSS